MADEIKILISGDSKEAQAALKAMSKALDKSKKKVTGMKAALQTFKKNWIGITAAFVGVSLVIRKTIQDASELEEVTSKFNTVFRGVTESADEMKNELIAAFGMSRIEATKSLSTMQDFLVPMGLARDKAAELSGQFVRMAVDLGSFNDMPTADVMRDIQSAMAGMSMPMRKYGVDVSEGALKQEALNQGLTVTTEKLDRETRAMMILSKISADSADAMGDFQKTQDSFANTMKTFNARIEDVSSSFGTLLLPVAQKAVKVMTDLATSFGKFLDKMNEANKITSLYRKEMEQADEILVKFNLNAKDHQEKIFGLANLYELWNEAVTKGNDGIIESSDTIALYGEALNEAKEKLGEINITGLEAVEIQRQIREAWAKNTEAFKQALEIKKQLADKDFKEEQKLKKQREKEEKKKLKAEEKIRKAVFEEKKFYAKAGVDAVVEAANAENASVKSVAAAVVKAEARALSSKMAMRAIAAFASLNIALGVGYTAAAAAILGAGNAAASGIMQFQHGGVIDEPVIGIGQRTGRAYEFGEAGPETVTPGRPEDNGVGGGEGVSGGGNLIIEQLNIYEASEEIIMNTLVDYGDRMGLNVITRSKQ